MDTKDIIEKINNMSDEEKQEIFNALVKSNSENTSYQKFKELINKGETNSAFNVLVNEPMLINLSAENIGELEHFEVNDVSEIETDNFYLFLECSENEKETAKSLFDKFDEIEEQLKEKTFQYGAVVTDIESDTNDILKIHVFKEIKNK